MSPAKSFCFSLDKFANISVFLFGLFSRTPSISIYNLEEGYIAADIPNWMNTTKVEFGQLV